jgi:hypothetical protein
VPTVLHVWEQNDFISQGMLISFESRGRLFSRSKCKAYPESKSSMSSSAFENIFQCLTIQSSSEISPNTASPRRLCFLSPSFIP